MGRAAVMKPTADADRTGEQEFPTAFQVQSRDPARLGKKWGTGCTTVPKEGMEEGGRDYSPNYQPKIGSPAGVPPWQDGDNCLSLFQADLAELFSGLMKSFTHLPSKSKLLVDAYCLGSLASAFS